MENRYPNTPKTDIVNNNLNANTDRNEVDIYSNEATTPYMGQVNSRDIGAMPFAGRLGGEMVRRMIKQQEERLVEEYNNDQLK